MKKNQTMAYLSIVMMVFSWKAQAIPCFITLAKDSCWTNYDVMVEVKDDKLNKTMIALSIPKGKSWARQQLDCKPDENFYYTASFKPAIWENQEAMTYRSKRYWSIPNQIPAEYVVWEIKVCYASDFAGLPLPPDANGNCQCDFASIPAIKPPAKS